ncbi:Qa-SNARE protein [Novymonas esmeraldas]|uniref:Qa-SNARE protein n=1 Tax=Novymonas esmeraldas TaxID=1808958 RepID=A0AAW0ENY4_9TRYP
MADAALYHEELLDLERQVDTLLADVDARHSSVGGGNVNATAARAAVFAKAQDTLRRLSRHLQQLRVEVRLLDGEERDVYEAHAGEHARRIASLRERVQQVKERAAQSTIAAATAAASSSGVGGGGAAGQFERVEGGAGVMWSPREDGDARDGEDGPVVANRMEARQAATRINEVQQSTLQSLGRSEKLLNETETLGNEAATTLRAQTEQIKRTNDELDEMHSELGRASTELKSFMRRMARDRLIIFFVIAIVVCIIVIVILAVVKHTLK